MLILFQGVLAGSAGGFVYAPIYVYVRAPPSDSRSTLAHAFKTQLSEWFVARRALAGGTVFAGAGLGGYVLSRRSLCSQSRALTPCDPP
jgi:hypothetical protein